MRKLFDLSCYLVTDRELSLGRSLSYIVEKAVSGGATMVQLREKDADTRDFLILAKKLKEILRPSGIPLIINDRMDIALASGADGIHVGQSDMPVEEIRKYLGADVIIGLSVESVQDAADANMLDIDYIGISPVYTTPTKKDLKSGLGLKGVREIAEISKFPSVGIGGINIKNTADIIKAGAAGIAVVSAVCGADNPEKAAQDLSDQVASAKAAGLLQ